MSIKAKSKNESESSPAAGTTPDPAPPSEAGGRDKVAAPRAKGNDETVTVLLVSDRSRRATWTLIGGALGGLLLVNLGTVAAAAGAALVALALYHGWFLLKTLRNLPGAVVVDASHVTLPTGLCETDPQRFEMSAVGAAYFLRHNVPWNRTGPVLVIEAGARAFLYPRDWFASEADQRRIMHAVLPRLGAHASTDGAS